MKKVLGLDLGTTSIGWALVNEDETGNQQSAIIKTGVRVIPYGDNLKKKNPKTGKLSDVTNVESDYLAGQGISPNMGRTQKRGARRNLNRYQQRRSALKSILKKAGILAKDTVLSETGKGSTHTLWELRAKAAVERIELDEFARVLLAINKKRGYKSNRKAKDEGDGQAIDSIGVAMELYDRGITPAEYSIELLESGSKQLPDYYRSDLQKEFDRVWSSQKRFYADKLTDELYKELLGKHKTATWKICEEPFEIKGRIQKGTAAEKRLETLQWRVKGLDEQLNLEQLAIVLSDINGQISGSSGYLGAISDRSKQLIIQKQTVGQYLYAQLQKNPHSRLKDQVFYRQDYLDEFEQIWETQVKHHSALTEKLKSEIRDVVIFHQRPLKSQKGQLSVCELEGKEIEIEVDGKTKKKRIGPKVCPKSSPLFQEFKIWQILNNLELSYVGAEDDLPSSAEKGNGIEASGKKWGLDLELRQKLFNELNIREKLTVKQVIKTLGLKSKDWELNYKTDIEGNRTNAAFYKAFSTILERAGYEPLNFNASSDDIKSTVEEIFNSEGIDADILHFDASIAGKAFEKQKSYLFWHLLYSYEGDGSRTGNERLIKKLEENFGFSKEYAEVLLGVTLQDDHGSLSAKAIRKILPELKSGLDYYEACDVVGYNHSHSVTKEQNEKRQLAEKLELLPKNSLRNPVVEKILNQMVNVVNQVVEVYGKPGEIRVELARELKASAKERAEMTSGIAKATKDHDQYRKEIAELYPFNTGVRITRNDLVKYKLYKELASNGHRTIYTDTYIPKEKLFTKEFDIEHIIPKAKLFDDSFSNKTISVRQINLEKGNDTAYDFLKNKYGEDSHEFKSYLLRVEKLIKEKQISRSKYKKLLMQEADIPDGFIERDLRNTQFISKKAVQMLLNISRKVTPTTGKVTDKLRQDWQLINVLQELNMPRYEKLGLVETQKNKHGDVVKKIKGWSKRNDHRHHAMDALAVAFTKPSHIQYLNYLNARKDETRKKHGNIHAIEQKETYVAEKGKRLFKPPMPIEKMRAEAKRNLENTLISFKAKNKVVTKNKNRIKQKNGELVKAQLTPRGQLHKETVYGKKKRYKTKPEKVGPKFDEVMISKVAKKSHRLALMARLQEFGNDPKKAFGGQNALAKNPIYIDKATGTMVPEKVKLVWLEDGFTIRKDISPDLKLEKVVDEGVKRILQQRLDDFGGDPKKAFVNLEEKPIWMNEQKGVQLKRVTITGVNTAEPLHHKKDHQGKLILDNSGKPIPVDYVQSNNNHHIAIYEDADGNNTDEAVTFSDAVKRKLNGISVVVSDSDKMWSEIIAQGMDDQQLLATLPEQGLKLKYSLKQNEYFILGMDSSEFETCMNDENYSAIGSHLYITWAAAKNDYWFKHHLETRNTDLKDSKKAPGAKEAKLYYRCGLKAFLKLKPIKVRLNHIGQIVHVGEY